MAVLEAWTIENFSKLDWSILILPFATIVLFLLPFVYLFPPIPMRREDVLSTTHLKVGLPSSESNLQQQLSSRHDATVGKRPTVQSLYIYPVKSCKGIELARSKVLPTGLEFDRLFTFAQLKSPFPLSSNEENKEKQQHTWEFITQRQFPLLATVKVDVWVPNAMAGPIMEQKTESWIVLRFPWREQGFWGVVEWIFAKMGGGWDSVPEREVLLPLQFPSEREIELCGYTFEEVKIWKEKVVGLNMSVELPRELMLYLGVSNKLGLFRIDPSKLRDVYRCAPRKAEVGYQPIVGFQDAYPLHLMNLTSLRDLDSKISKDSSLQELDVRRLRSNIIISGAPAYDEESWKSIRLIPAESKVGATTTFHVSCRTVRCKMPNVDQSNGVRHDTEPDSSLGKYRSVDGGAPLKGCLGMQLCPLFEQTSNPDAMFNWIEVGMQLEVLETGEHFYIKQ